MTNFSTIRTALLDLRARTGMNYASAVKAGRFQLQLVSFDSRGVSTVTELTGWVGADEFVAAVAARW